MDQDDAYEAAHQQQLEQQEMEEEAMGLTQRLAAIQKELNAPKGQYNKFGGYHYRSCEDILMAVKPLLGDLVLTITDEIVMVGDRVYVKATATITDGKERIETTAYAREALTKKGMDESQITGSASSYARKYAMNGLLLIDDNKDADHHDNRAENGAKTKQEQKPAFSLDVALSDLEQAADIASLKAKFAVHWKAAPGDKKAAIKQAYDDMKAYLEQEKETA